MAGIISARMPVPYPRMKSRSRVSDTRLMASNFYIAQLRFLDNDGYGQEKRALRSATSSTDATPGSRKAGPSRSSHNPAPAAYLRSKRSSGLPAPALPSSTCREAPIATSVAKKIVRLAKKGECNPTRLTDGVISSLRANPVTVCE